MKALMQVKDRKGRGTLRQENGRERGGKDGDEGGCECDKGDRGVVSGMKKKKRKEKKRKGW
jgi:hypothetical protein